MKKSTKRLLSGVLASTLALSVTAAVGAKTTIISSKFAGTAVQAVPTEFLETQETKTLSTQELRAAYFNFYQTYGAEKAADVFYNGQALDFVDAFPLIQDGTTFVPLAVFADAIGAETNYIADTHSVSLEYKGNTITFDINDTAFYVNGGQAQELPYATFIASERTMVPVRFITDAFDLDLYWNGTNKQVIAADLSALDTSNHSYLEGILQLSSGEETEKNTRISGDLDYVVSMDGKSVEFQGTLSALTNEDLSAVNYSMDFTTNLQDFQEDISAMLDALSAYPSDAETMATLLQAVEQFNLNYVYDINDMNLYMQSDLITSGLPLFASSDVVASLPITTETWYQLEMSDFMFESEVEAFRAVLSQASATESITTMEGLVEAVMELTRSCDNHSVNLYGSLALLLSTCKDDQFVQNDTVYTKSIFLSDGKQEVKITLAAETDGGTKVNGYTATMQFADGSQEGMQLVVGQSSQNQFDILLNMVSGAVTVDCVGSFAVEYVDEKAVVLPQSSDIYDLTRLF